jgi:hypothetical protein
LDLLISTEYYGKYFAAITFCFSVAVVDEDSGCKYEGALPPSN